LGDPRLATWLEEATGLRHASVMIENMLDPQSVMLDGLLPRDAPDALVERTQPPPRSVSSNKNAPTPRLIAADMGRTRRHSGPLRSRSLTASRPSSPRSSGGMSSNEIDENRARLVVRTRTALR
jgi:predicted NBD/HSP70 family sugar kinase